MLDFWNCYWLLSCSSLMAPQTSCAYTKLGGLHTLLLSQNSTVHNSSILYIYIPILLCSPQWKNSLHIKARYFIHDNSDMKLEVNEFQRMVIRVDGVSSHNQ